MSEKKLFVEVEKLKKKIAMGHTAIAGIGRFVFVESLIEWIDSLAVEPEPESLVKARESYKHAVLVAAKNTIGDITPWEDVKELAVRQSFYIHELEARIK